MKKYIKSNFKSLLLAIAFSILAASFAVKVQFLKGDVLDHALARDLSHTLDYGLKLGIFIILELGFFYLYDRARGKFAVDASRELKSAYFQNLLTRDYPKFLEKKQGEYIAQYTNEIEIVENQYFSTIPMLAEIIIKIVIVSISLFVLDYRVALITLVLLTTPLYVPKLVEKRLQKAQVEHVKQVENHIKIITNWLSGFELIKNFSIANKIGEQFMESNRITMEKNLRKRQMGYLARTISAILSYSSHFIILVFAAYLVLKGDFTGGDFFIAVGMIDQLSYPIISLSYFIQDLVSVQPVNKSIMEFIEEKSGKDGEREIDPKDFRQIVFDKVYFAYDKEDDILKGLDMSFQKNKQYLLQGPSGSGKTTSMNLLLNYYRPKKGDIRINKLPLGEIKNLNEIITIMRQDAIFFQDNLRNNISMYRDLPDEEIIDALDKVGLSSYANRESLDSLVEEGASNFSGGEKRRISLARALLRKTPILILDEPLANLDVRNAQDIESQLLKIKDRTLIIISHQFSPKNINKLDKIIEFK